MNFRHRLEVRQLASLIWDRVNALLETQGLLLCECTIVDATLMATPLSTKNQDQPRDLERHQTQKGNHWQFGRKIHIGVDTASGLIHTAVGTAANVNDRVMTGELLHGREHRVYADASYTGVSHPTYYQWKSKYPGLSVNELKQIKELEAENSRLKRMDVDLAFENAAINDMLSQKW